MRGVTRKITTAAVCTALSVILCAATAYLPLSIMPLYLAAFCIFLACKRAGLPYGLLCAAATVGIMFAMTGLSIKWFFFVLMFAPYGIATYFAHHFTYFKVKSGIIRGVCAAAYFNLTLGAVYLIATRVLTAGIDMPIADWTARLGGYWAIAIIATVALVPLDFIFSAMSSAVLKRIPAIGAPREKKFENVDKPNANENIAPPKDEKRYDIFGYEITETNVTEHERDGEKPDGDG